MCDTLVALGSVTADGVAIRNEGVFTRVPYDKRPGLIGMDLLRLALRRRRVGVYWKATGTA